MYSSISFVLLLKEFLTDISLSDRLLTMECSGSEVFTPSVVQTTQSTSPHPREITTPPNRPSATQPMAQSTVATTTQSIFHTSVQNLTTVSSTFRTKDISLMSIMLVLILVVIIIIILVVILAVICIFRKRIRNQRHGGQGNNEIFQMIDNNPETNEYSSTGPDYANIPNNNNDSGIEYAEINTNLLVPKPKQETEDTETESAPLVYADLAFEENAENTQISPDSKITHSSMESKKYW